MQQQPSFHIEIPPHAQVLGRTKTRSNLHHLRFINTNPPNAVGWYWFVFTRLRKRVNRCLRAWWKTFTRKQMKRLLAITAVALSSVLSFFSATNAVAAPPAVVSPRPKFVDVDRLPLQV